jgi:hypothetical protein
MLTRRFFISTFFYFSVKPQRKINLCPICKKFFRSIKGLFFLYFTKGTFDFMKIRFLINTLFFSLLLSSNLFANQAPQNYKEAACTITPIASQREHRRHPHIPGPTSAALPKNMTSSSNWSGYAAANNLANPARNSVSQVFGSWIVPTIGALNNTYCSIWVGIDGYSSPTVEQIGTSHNWLNGKQQNNAWFEMYPGGSFSINGFPLTPGDVISASVEYTGNNVFTMRLYNDTQKVVANIPTSYTISATALRNSAEWIVEAPYLNGILPLSKFTTAYLWGCTANINGVSGPLNNSAWQNNSIEMLTGNGIPKAIPSTLIQDQESFFVTWNHQ